MNRVARWSRCNAASLLAVTLLCSHAHAAVGQGRSPDPALPFIPPPSLEPEHLFAAPTRPDRIGRVLAPVIINGQGPFRLMVDTGANQSVLTAKAIHTLGLTVSQDTQVRINGVTGAVLVPTVSINTFETGDLRQQGLQLPVVQSVMGGADGVLGMQGFDGKRISVDFMNDEIRIATSRGQRLPPGFVRLPVKIRFDRLLLASGRVDGTRVHAVIDTGAQRTLGNLALRSELRRRKQIDAPPMLTGVIGLSEVEQRGEVLLTRRVRLGEITVRDVDVIYGDIDVFRLWNLQDEPALLVGMDVLGTLDTLIIDYRLQELQIRIRD